MPQFKNSRLKIERANQHILDIESRIDRMFKSVEATVEINPTTKEETLKHQFGDKKAFLDIALMLGDAIHNLKCALDYAWLETVEKLAPHAVSDYTRFPVRSNANELKNALVGAKIDQTAPDLVKFMLTEVKPYHGGNPAIWSVHNLDIRDKHRLLIPVFADVSITGITVQDHTGESWQGFTTPTTLPLLAYAVTYETGIHVKDKGKLACEIIFEDGISFDFMDVPETIIYYSRLILEIVEAFEAFLQTALRIP